MNRDADDAAKGANDRTTNKINDVIVDPLEATNENNDILQFSFDNWFARSVTYCTTAEIIGSNAQAILDLIEQQLLQKQLDGDHSAVIVLGLDAEWKVPINADGRVCGPPDKAALIQIGYRDEDNQLQVSMYHVRRLKSLPRSLADLLHHKSIRFAGNGVTGDLSKISRDFSNIQIDTKNVGVNLYEMVTRRGVLVNGKGIDAISAVLLGERVDKGPRLSDWSMPKLSTNLRMYAAKDARNSLLCYEHLAKLPDLTESPSPNEIKAGLQVDIAPYMGSNYTIGSCAAIGEIDMNQKWSMPENLKMPMPKVVGGSPGWYVVKVKKVIAPSMAIKKSSRLAEDMRH